MSTVDLYDVLNVESDCSKKEIIKAYRKLVKKYHPDKPGGDRDLFELIDQAFDTLSNDVRRKEYDDLQKLSKDASKKHYARKKEFDEFLEVQDSGVTATTKDEAKLEFKKDFDNLDLKHNFDRSENAMKKIDEDAADKMMDDLLLLREQEDIENTHEQIFEEGEKFDLSKFNEAFMKAHGGPDDLIPHTGNPNAWHTGDAGGNYSTFDSNYGELYHEGEDNPYALDGDKYSGVNSGHSYKELTKEDVKNLKGDQSTFGHNKGLDDKYNKSLEELMQEHMNNRNDLLDKDLSQFDTNPDMGGYGIFKDFGNNATAQLEWDNKEDLEEKYKKLKNLRKVAEKKKKLEKKAVKNKVQSD